MGDNSVLNKAKRAKVETQIADYKEQLEIIIMDEVTDRKIEEKEEPLIDALDTKIREKEKEWVKSTSKETNDNLDYLIVESNEGYEFVIEVNEEKDTAKLVSSSKTSGEKYTITFDANGGTGTQSSVNIRNGFSCILPECSFTKEDYVFVGWCANSDGTGTKYLPGSDKYKPNTNVTLYAMWSYNVATITFDANGGTGSMENKKVTKGEDTVLPENQFTRNEYIFKEWNTKNDGTGTAYKDGDVVVINQDTVLYAQWEASINIGDYVRYGVSYTDMYSKYEFTADDGWRVLESGSRNDDGTYTGTKLVSTGIPALLYYHYYYIKDTSWVGTDQQRIDYKNKFWAKSSENDGNIYVASGLYYNFSDITFKATSSPDVSNGGYIKINNEVDDITGNIFLSGGGTEVHALTLTELNLARGKSNQTDVTSTAKLDADIGLFYLKNLNKFNYNNSTSSQYWLATPSLDANTNWLCVASEDGTFSHHDCTTFGVRPVITLPDNSTLTVTGN